ncbi:hypothetical protein GCK72_009557 [Caenorhabditis remanei]|uniref:Uncharacterized protein n=1 Tax=Caenorhabditis remanei TaxID=31234 RepID=A0A6A5H2Q6_CAERE|nr:hypothetical protein GCK72_009557 [Caenorhabditis remanei]KAF1761301.1 hypothetical protein GCK72_009557 [Caenorhabditis remanei]
MMANTETTIECSKHIFIETIREMTDFTDTQLETLQNLSPKTKKKLKTTIMDVLSSLGLLLEMSVSPSISMTTLPIYIFRAQNLMALEKDFENMKPEAENMSDSLEIFKRGLSSIVNNIPIKAMKCLQSQ